jgi:hypothetical protein
LTCKTASCGGRCRRRRWLSWSLVVKERMQAATSQVVTLVMFKHTRDDPDVCLVSCLALLNTSVVGKSSSKPIQTHPSTPRVFLMGDFNGIHA